VSTCLPHLSLHLSHHGVGKSLYNLPPLQYSRRRSTRLVKQCPHTKSRSRHIVGYRSVFSDIFSLSSHFIYHLTIILDSFVRINAKVQPSFLVHSSLELIASTDPLNLKSGPNISGTCPEHIWDMSGKYIERVPTFHQLRNLGTDAWESNPVTSMTTFQSRGSLWWEQ